MGAVGSGRSLPPPRRAPAPLPCAASSERPPSSSSGSGTRRDGTARSMGGGRRADKGAGRGARLSAPGAARGQRGLQTPAEPPQPTQGPGRAVQLSRPGGGRDGGGAAGRPLPSPLDRSPPGTSWALPPGTPRPKGAQAHGRAGSRDPRLLPGGGRGRGAQSGGRHSPLTPHPPCASETRSPPHPSAGGASWVAKVSSARLRQKGSQAARGPQGRRRLLRVVTIRGAPCGTRPASSAPNPRSAGFAPSPSLRAGRPGLCRSVANSRCVPGCDLALPSGDRQWGGQRTDSTSGG